MLRSDIVENHKMRIAYLKKYLPFFRLQDVNLTQFKDGKYAMIDMGYIMMALLRYLMEENHFNDQTVSYQKISEFLCKLLSKDFDLILSEEEQKEICEYLFDKIRNDGKPFMMDYFDPEDKKIKTARMHLVDAVLKQDTVEYSISADAIEFYLETKEVVEESKINIQQLLLEKMIAAKNFRGGIDVVRRINSEVTMLRLKKQEVISALTMNVFEGIKALDDFQKNGMKWFSQEQRAFEKNKSLIEQALKKAEEGKKGADNKTEYQAAIGDIYDLETELQKAMSHHLSLLSDCTQLQMKADEIIARYKYSRLRSRFDFHQFLSDIKKKNDVSELSHLILPLCIPYIQKTFPLNSIEALLSYPMEKEEHQEVVSEESEVEYQFEDEIEEQRIQLNFSGILKVLLPMLYTRETITLRELNQELQLTYFDDIFKNSDYYSFLVHLCQKRKYVMDEIIHKPDTFFDQILSDFVMQEQYQKYRHITFQLDMEEEMQDEFIQHTILGEKKELFFVTTDITFRCIEK